MSTPATESNPSTTVNIFLTTPPNPSPAYRGMLEALAVLKRVATWDHPFGAVYADFDINDEETKFTAAFSEDNTTKMAEFAIYLEIVLHMSLSGKRLTDMERWTRIQNLAKSFINHGWEGYGPDGWVVVHQLLGNDAIIALSVMSFDTEEEANEASRIYRRLGVTEGIVNVYYGDGYGYGASPASSLVGCNS